MRGSTEGTRALVAGEVRAHLDEEGEWTATFDGGFTPEESLTAEGMVDFLCAREILWEDEREGVLHKARNDSSYWQFLFKLFVSVALAQNMAHMANNLLFDYRREPGRVQ